MGPRIRHPPLPADDVAVIPAAEPGADLGAWRQERLLRAGVETDLAASIAADCAMDLHAMIELVERGCPPELAARILAPFDHERSPC
jgi:hypothetical protein